MPAVRGARAAGGASVGRSAGAAEAGRRAVAPEHLLQTATNLAEINPRRPRRADPCRAASTTYYALFHCLARTCADRLAGSGGTVGNRPMWRRVYRALEHRQARTRCENVPPSFPEEIVIP